MWFVKSLFVLFFLNIVRSEDTCVLFDFEDGLQDLFSASTGICAIVNQLWIEGNYADVDIEPPNALSTAFIKPLTSLSCATSFEFTMSVGGLIEFSVYMSGESSTDQLSIIVSQSEDDTVVGNLVLNPGNADFVAGWTTHRVSIVGSGTFQGYITFFGMTENSGIIVDSFRYIPPGEDEDSCVVYNLLTTTTQTTDDVHTSVTSETVVPDSTENGEVTYTSTAATTVEANTGTPETEETTEAISTCTTYNFETDYDIHFFNDNYLCEGFLPWQWDNYTSLDVESPNSQSSAFITPHDTMSCINSFVFRMDPDGVVEANVYMDPVEALDHIIILAHRVTGREFDTTAGFKMYHPENQVFVAGWNVIRFSLLEMTSFDGYLIFLGTADANSTVLVDSFRYLPPGMSSDDPTCDYY